MVKQFPSFFLSKKTLVKTFFVSCLTKQIFLDCPFHYPLSCSFRSLLLHLLLLCICDCPTCMLVWCVVMSKKCVGVVCRLHSLVNHRTKIWLYGVMLPSKNKTPKNIGMSLQIIGNLKKIQNSKKMCYFPLTEKKMEKKIYKKMV